MSGIFANLPFATLITHYQLIDPGRTTAPLAFTFSLLLVSLVLVLLLWGLVRLMLVLLRPLILLRNTCTSSTRPVLCAWVGRGLALATLPLGFGLHVGLAFLWSLLWSLLSLSARSSRHRVLAAKLEKDNPKNQTSECMRGDAGGREVPATATGDFQLVLGLSIVHFLAGLPVLVSVIVTANLFKNAPPGLHWAAVYPPPTWSNLDSWASVCASFFVCLRATVCTCTSSSGRWML